MAGYDFSNLSIMIVDDDMLMRNLVKSMLFSLGITKVSIQNNPEEAINEIITFKPDILITDWEMKPINGLAFSKKIRGMNNPLLSHLPIIMLTGYSQLERVFAAREVGINEFLAKPVSVQTLYSRILSIAKRPRDFVKTKNYFGPDRRRKDVPFVGEDRRKRKA